MTDANPPTAAGIARAYASIDPVFRDSPLMRHDMADAALGCRLSAKVETLNPIRAFKGRGTDWMLTSLAGDDAPLVAASAGNFGQGLAYAARKRGRRLTVFAATTANPLKIAAMRRLGADVILAGADFDAAKLAARAFAQANGQIFIEDGASAAIAEGAGTMALELTRALAGTGDCLDAVLVPLGNGSLLTGIGTWLKAEMPACKVIGIVDAAAPSMLLSWRAQKPVSTQSAASFADGIAVREPVPYALDCMRTTVDDVWSVSEPAIRQAMRFCRDHYGVLVEPAGVAGVAAVLENRAALPGQRVATILCGSNLTPEQIKDYFS